jgi:hypothetical protein
MSKSKASIQLVSGRSVQPCLPTGISECMPSMGGRGECQPSMGGRGACGPEFGAPTNVQPACSPTAALG